MDSIIAILVQQYHLRFTSISGLCAAPWMAADILVEISSGGCRSSQQAPGQKLLDEKLSLLGLLDVCNSEMAAPRRSNLFA